MIGVIITLVISFVVSIIWVNGIDSMHRNHPDYDGKDFLNEK